MKLSEYELLLVAKLDCIMCFKAKQLRHSELSFFQNQLDLERTQNPT